MVIQDKYYDEDERTQPSTHDNHLDAPPSYEAISTPHSHGQPGSGPAHPVNEKFPPPSSGSFLSGTRRVGPTPLPGGGHSQSGLSSWLPKLSFTSSRTSKQVQQTVLALVRALVLNAESPDLLSNCADACRTYGLNLSALLQEQSIENHSAIYWAVLNHRDALLQSLLVHAAPLSQSTLSDIRLACLITSNQPLFQSLRCLREPFTKQMIPLSTSPGADALVLGSLQADHVSIREMDGQGEFVAEMRINLWQKRMRVSGHVSVEFIARGRVWSLTFFSPPSTNYTTVGMWQVALCLLEHSPPTFIDSRLVIDLPPSPSNTSTLPANASPVTDLISLSPPPDVTTTTNAPSPPPPSPPWSNRSKSKSKAPQPIHVHLKSSHRLAYRASDTFLTSFDAMFSNLKDRSRPHVEQWTENGDSTYTNAVIVPLDDGAGAELLYDNTPYITMDGTLYARLEARLGRPNAPECVIC